MLRVFIQYARDIPTADIVSLLDFFTQPQAENKRPLVGYVRKELEEHNSKVTVAEIEAVNLMCKRFLYATIRSESMSPSHMGF